MSIYIWIYINVTTNGYNIISVDAHVNVCSLDKKDDDINECKNNENNHIKK